MKILICVLMLKKPSEPRLLNWRPAAVPPGRTARIKSAQNSQTDKSGNDQISCNQIRILKSSKRNKIDPHVKIVILIIRIFTFVATAGFLLFLGKGYFKAENKPAIVRE